MKKIKLSQLKVHSFVTERKEFKGGKVSEVHVGTCWWESC